VSLEFAKLLNLFFPMTSMLLLLIIFFFHDLFLVFKVHHSFVGQFVDISDISLFLNILY
jgi:hypothetical protein